MSESLFEAKLDNIWSEFGSKTHPEHSVDLLGEIDNIWIVGLLTATPLISI